MKTDIKNDFLVYAIEEYKYLEEKTVKDVMELFSTHNIFDYILRHYVVLHTMGGRAIADEINLYISRSTGVTHAG